MIRSGMTPPAPISTSDKAKTTQEWAADWQMSRPYAATLLRKMAAAGTVKAVRVFREYQGGIRPQPAYEVVE